MHLRSTRRALAALGVTAALLLAACGSDKDDTAATPVATGAAAATDAPPASEAGSGDTTAPADAPVVVASTSWVAAIAEMAGASDVAYIAPNNVQHPPDYEPTASDLAALADADYVLMAGFEGFAEQLTEASGSDAEIVTVMPSYDPAMLRGEAEKLAALWGTEEAAAANLDAYDAGYAAEAEELQALTADQDQVVVAQAFAVEWVALAGFAVAGTYGPAPATAGDIADLAALEPTLVFDNVHMGGGAEVAEASGATLVELANFPGDDLDLLAVVHDNAHEITHAVEGDGHSDEGDEGDEGDGMGDMDMPGATTYPLTITNCGREVTFERAPERVLILNGTSVAEVESFIALGLEDHILANSQSYGASDVEGMLEQIAALPTGGLTLNENFEVPKEQTLALEPDLVISTWAGGFSEAMGSVTRDQLAEVGINSYVTPVNCAYGADDPSAEDQAVYESQTYEASFDLLRELGAIFDVQDKAAEVIADAEATIEAVSRPAGDEPVHVLVAYPGMSMSANGIPAVFAGPFTDSIIEAAGGVNSFDGFASFADSMSINAEALAAADVDVLVVGLFLPGESADDYAAQLFEQFPQWDAAKSNTYLSIAESVYLGPFNAVAIDKIGTAVASVG